MVATTSHIFSGKVDIASNLQVGSSRLFVDTENNRVGINESDPDASLHVTGNAYIETNVDIGSTINLEGATGNVTVSGNVHATGVKVNGINVALDPDLSDNASRISVLETDATSNAGRVTSLEESNIEGVRTDLSSNAGRIDDLFAANTVQSDLISAITTDMTSNAGRIDDLLTANTVQSDLISAITIDMTSNAGRIDDLLTANTVQSDLISAITTDMTSNAGRINDMFAANTVQGDLITDITDDMTSNAGRIDLIITDMTSNAGRIDDMFAANTVQSGLISAITTDMTSNSGRIDGLDTRIGNLETANNVQESLINTLITSNADIWSNLADNVTRITVLENDMASNADRITNLETSNVDIWSNLAANVIRITNLETANTVQRDLITDITGDMTSNAGRIDVIISDVLSNALRLNQMFAANTVQGGLITAITTDMTSNAGRIDDLFTANTVQSGLITDITTDMTSNAGRIDDLFAANTVQGGLITDITTDMTSNAGRIDDLFTANTVQGGLITDITTDMTSNAGRIDDLFAANTVQGGLISAITTDMTSNAARVQYITTVADTTFIASNLEVTGNIFMRGDRFVVESETKLINDAVIGIANNNTLSTTDVGIVMQRPDANVALVHHGSGSGSYPDQFTMGYTQSTLTDGDITTDEANIFTLNVLGNVTAQNNITSTTSTVSNVTTMGTTKTFVVTAAGGAYYIDGVIRKPLELHEHQTYIFDLSDSSLASGAHPFSFSTAGTDGSGTAYSAGISTTGTAGTTGAKKTFIVPAGTTSPINYYCSIHGGMGSTMSIASTSELIVSGRVVASGNVEASAFIGDGTKLTGVALSADMTSNAGRIDDLFTANTVQSGLISAITTDMTSNAGRIDDLFTANTVQSGLITAITTDMTSNAGRIDDLFTANTVQGGLITDITTDMTSNAGRIDDLFTANTVQGGLITAITTDMTANATRVDALYTAATGDIIYATGTDTLGKLNIGGTAGHVLKVSAGGVPEWAAESGGAAGVLVSNSVGITTGFTQGDIIYASADNTLSKLALGSSGQVLKSDGTDVVWGTDGGGGSTVWLTNGNKIHYDADNVGIGTSTPAFKLDVHGTANVGALTATTLSVGGADVALDADMTANAARVDALYTGTAGQLIYGTGTDTLGKLNIGTTGHVLKVAGGVPVWAAESGGASGGGQWTGTSEIYFEGNVGISNTDPDHDLSVGSNLFIDDDGSNVLVISGNAAMSALTLGQVSIVASYGLDDILSTSNISSNTMRLTNATTGLVVSSNIVVTGNVTAGYLYGDVSNVTGITSNLHQIAENGNVTSNTLQFTNATTGFVTTANVEVGGELTVSSNLTVTGNATVSSNLTVTGNVLVSDDLTVTGNVSDLNIVSNVNMLHTSNTASLKLNSNVVTEFPRSKKLIKYPRVALTGYSQDGYVVSSTTNYYDSGNPLYPWQVFNDSGHRYQSNRSDYSSSTGNYTGTVNQTTVDGSLIGGDWVQLELPNKISLNRFTVALNMGSHGGRMGRSYVLTGSNNGSTWTTVSTHTQSYGNGADGNHVNHNVNSTTTYKYYRLIATSTFHNTQANGGPWALGKWELYGTPEYDPEANGVDVVVKSVPNVPNTDWLDIYIDGQDYTSMPSGSGSVLDKSTNNRHGTPSNVTFNSTWKAFEIESASTSNITVPFNSTGGAYVHTIALWFLMDTTAGGNRCIFTIRGSESTGKQIALILNQDSTSIGFKYDFYSADIRYYDPSVSAGKWMHCVVTYSGGANNVSKEIYLDGVKLPASGTSTGSLALTGTENLIIGGNLNSGNASFEGMVANFRMFNRVLTPDEIYQLYAYQKEYFGHGVLGMTLKAGRLGIGTSEPRAALDVRGDIYGGCPVFFQAICDQYFSATSYLNGSGGALIPWDTLFEHKGDCFNTSTGLFTAPIDGAYKFGYSVRKRSGTLSDDFWTYIQKNGAPLNGTNNSVGRVYADSSNSDPESVFASQAFILDLSAGDTIGVLLAESNNAGADASISSGYNNFHGHYIGRGNGSFGSYSY